MCQKQTLEAASFFSVLYNEAVIAFFVINICITSHPDGNCIARYFNEKTWINRFGGISLKNSLFWNSNLFGKQGSGVFRPPASFASKSGWNWFPTLSIVIYLFIFVFKLYPYISGKFFPNLQNSILTVKSVCIFSGYHCKTNTKILVSVKRLQCYI